MMTKDIMGIILKDKVEGYNFNYTDLKEILKVCFYKRNLPIGFITSPTISNIYMLPFDESITENKYYDGVMYTRYADDILISLSQTKDEKIELMLLKSVVSSSLKKYKLTLNNKKEKMVKLNNYGDYIKYLGINI